MTFKIFVCVWVFLLTFDGFVGANIPSKSPPNGSNMSPSPFASTRERENAEWGKKIKNIAEYRKLKHTCYLALRNGELCCIDFPDCPHGLEPEIPLKPYHLFPIKKLSLGCARPKVERKKKTWKNRSSCLLRRNNSTGTWKWKIDC